MAHGVSPVVVCETGDSGSVCLPRIHATQSTDMLRSSAASAP
ncbi:hypothetical protein D554_2897 [Bordetella holmesii 30539]|nr:hypothetical protein D560_2975 [Bordetella holmesii ATCC 51541]AIT27603.1 hypothetical protein D558_2950 [Bordetella holmesii 44057]EWM40377.1 hypothetical protein D555_3009 [Bordetella holmesii 35009]EWM43706.1 hypothetical protein D556_2949 [Bordetella holmesii 41130]EWM49181.1 hypothetical protein D557_2252 [Bordetella holmesii 70147]EXF87633.1 hypothetical protein D554_2897 [Bordetella holmesii 30539]